jgi:hypothetical protein
MTIFFNIGEEMLGKAYLKGFIEKNLACHRNMTFTKI